MTINFILFELWHELHKFCSIWETILQIREVCCKNSEIPLVLWKNAQWTPLSHIVYIANAKSKSTKKGENLNKPCHTDSNRYVEGELVSYVS